MVPERLDRAFAVFDAAVRLPEAERDAYLAGECGDDPQLREEVRSLLAAHDEADGFLSGRRSRDREINIIETGVASPSRMSARPVILQTRPYCKLGSGIALVLPAALSSPLIKFDSLF